MKFLTILLAILAVTQGIHWQQFQSYFVDDPNQVDKNMWILPNENALTPAEVFMYESLFYNYCGSTSSIEYFGGVGFQLSSLLGVQIDASSISHDFVKLELDFLLLDYTPTLYQQFLDQLALNIQDPYYYTIELLNSGDFCNNFPLPNGTEYYVRVSIQFYSTDDIIEFTSLAPLASFLDVNPFGVNNIVIYLEYVCPNAGEVFYNGSCIPQHEAQACYDILQELDPSPANNQSITNTCEVEEINGEIIYNYYFDFHPDYVHDPNCFGTYITFHGEEITQGDSVANFGQWTQTGQQIHWKINHDELYSQGYACTFNDNVNDFQWICIVQLTIIADGYDQLTYEFQAKSTLAKEVDAKTIVTINQNVVVGECCDNELGIETALKICGDSQCSFYEDTNPLTPFEFTRMDTIYVEHIIVTAEFQYLYLNLDSIKLGVFTPDYTIEFAGPGVLRISFPANIAADAITISVISTLYELRRNLRALSFTEENYNVKGEERISIIEGLETDGQNQITSKSDELIAEEKKTQQEYQEKQQMYQTLMVVVGALSAICIGSVIGGIVYYKISQKKFLLQQNKMKYQQGNNLSKSKSSVIEQITSKDQVIAAE